MRDILRKSRLLRRVRLLYWRGRFQFLRRFSPSWKAAAPDGLPVPPEELRFLISGQRDYPVGDFLAMGRVCAEKVEQSLRKQGVEMASMGAVLDFGCGCGRTLRHFAHLSPTTKLYGSDYNPVLVGWCRPNLAFAEFGVNALEPPLPHPDQAFDLVYAFSVFTHLPHRLQLLWMQELARVLKPGGWLVFSTMPSSSLDVHGPEARRRFDSGELVVINADEAGQNVCAAFHPDRYVRDTLAQGFAVRDFTPGGVGQDVWLLRKQAAASESQPIVPRP